MKVEETFTLKEAVEAMIDYCVDGHEFEALEELFMNEGHAHATVVMASVLRHAINLLPDLDLKAVVHFTGEEDNPEFDRIDFSIGGSTVYPDVDLVKQGIGGGSLKAELELVEHGNGYCLYWGSKTAWLGDGVDHMSDFEIGTEEFRTEWESEIKENWSEVKEAYFGEDN